ncbi:MAG TPA: phosphoribosyltransferase family protein, partial [Nocardioidaceae bacterium]|nr:phosphoribosyltransferase family protein [Nocardioidaceae bacterium]
MHRLRDRREAGRLLAERLEELHLEDALVLAVPRGGVPVGVEVAHHLGLPLDILVVRKLGLPFQPELAMGAVGEGGVTVLNDDVIRVSGVRPDEVTQVELRERAEVESRGRRLRGSRPPVPLRGRAVLLVDDGLATGSTMVAACRVARAAGATLVVVAVPTASREAVDRLRDEADSVVALMVPAGFSSVGQWYVDFDQVSDAEVVSMLESTAVTSADVEVPAAEGVTLAGRLAVPPHARGVVAFAHGSGSSRFSPRNGFVADRLNAAGMATLLLDLLTPAEEQRRDNVFDVDLLAGRLRAVLRWLAADPRTRGLPVGLFGASTGAAAALAAASYPEAGVSAVVSRGGRPDLAGSRL